MGRKYNFIIFGATGFTGKYLIEEMIKTTIPNDETVTGEEKPKPFTWAISGRSKPKLDESLSEIIEKNGLKYTFDVTKVDRILADVSDAVSINEMVKQCDVVLNCVGPYLLYGEEVVKACAEEGTHYVDASYEPPFFKLMNFKYKNVAEASGSYIVSSCGYASLPADYGSTFLQRKFEENTINYHGLTINYFFAGTVNSIDAHAIVFPKGGALYPKASYGTLSSVIMMIHKEFQLKNLYKEKMDNDKYLDWDYKSNNRFVQYTPEINSWSVRIPPPLDNDKVMMDSTQRQNLQIGIKPCQTQAFVKMPNLFVALLAAFALFLLTLIAKLRIGKYLLLTFPKLCTLGIVSKMDPTHEQMEAQLGYTIVLKGWDKTTSINDGIPPNKTLVLKIEYTNAYHVTAKMMVEAGITLITEPSQLPARGGIYSPGFAFGETSLAERLEKRGISFSIEDIALKKTNRGEIV